MSTSYPTKRPQTFAQLHPTPGSPIPGAQPQVLRPGTSTDFKKKDYPPLFLRFFFFFLWDLGADVPLGIPSHGGGTHCG